VTEASGRRQGGVGGGVGGAIRRLTGARIERFDDDTVFGYYCLLNYCCLVLVNDVLIPDAVSVKERPLSA
jgi:hypothetical protein